MNAAWKQDPRLKTMNQEKLNYLTKLAETVEQTPKDKLMPLFMSMAAGSGQFQFTDSETDLLVSIMTAKSRSHVGGSKPHLCRYSTTRSLICCYGSRLCTV